MNPPRMLMDIACGSTTELLQVGVMLADHVRCVESDARQCRCFTVAEVDGWMQLRLLLNIVQRVVYTSDIRSICVEHKVDAKIASRIGGVSTAG